MPQLTMRALFFSPRHENRPGARIGRPRRAAIALEVLEPRTLLAAGQRHAVLSGHIVEQSARSGHQQADVATASNTSLATTVANTFASAPATNPNSWTVMVYITGDDLNSDAETNILQMEALAGNLPAYDKIVVLYSQPTEYNAVYKPPLPVYKTGNDTQNWAVDTNHPFTTGVAEIQAPTSEAKPGEIYTTFQLSRQNTALPRTLSRFVESAERMAPAQNYTLVMWDHGNGVQGLNFDNNYPRRKLGDNYLTVQDLVNGLSQAKAAGAKISVLAFDECLMASVEVEYAVRNLTSYVVASEELEPGSGYNYQNAFGLLAANPGIVTPAQLAVSIVAAYANQYRGQLANNDTQSAVSTAALPGLATALTRFVSATRSASPSDWSALRAARAQAASYGGVSSSYRDLGQFLRAAAGSRNTRIRSAAGAAYLALQHAVLFSTLDKRLSTGLSVVLPAAAGLESIPPGYDVQAAAFIRATDWRRFLREFQPKGLGKPSSAGVPDWAEPNNSEISRTSLGKVYDKFVVPALTLPLPDEDWYELETTAPGRAGSAIVLNVKGPNDAKMQLYDLIGSSTDPDKPQKLVKLRQGHTRINLDGLPADKYVLQVSHARRNIQFAYTITIHLPKGAASQPSPSAQANNLSRANPDDLGTVDVGALMSPSNDPADSLQWTRTDASQDAWYRFETPASIEPLSGYFQVIGDSARNLVVTLYNQQGRPIKTVRGRTGVRVPYRVPGGGQPYEFSVGGGSGTYELFFSDLA